MKRLALLLVSLVAVPALVDAGRMVERAPRPHRPPVPAVRRRESHRRRRGSGAAGWTPGLRARVRLERQRSRPPHGHRHNTSASRRSTKAFTSVAILLVDGGTGRSGSRSSGPLHSRVCQNDSDQRCGASRLPAKRADHAFAICSPIPPAFPTARKRRSAREYEPKGLGPAAGFGWYTADKSEPILRVNGTARDAAVRSTAGRGGGCAGYNTDILGCIAERASGMSLDELIRTQDSPDHSG